MRKTSSIYRFLAIITVLTVFCSISLPACLFAKEHKANSCSLMPDRHTKSFSRMCENCDMPMSAQHQMRYQSQKQDMDMMNCYFSPECNVNGLFLKGESIVLTTAQTKAILPETALDFTGASQSMDSPHEIPPPNLKAPPPPVFLVNCTFLN